MKILLPTLLAAASFGAIPFLQVETQPLLVAPSDLVVQPEPVAPTEVELPLDQATYLQLPDDAVTPVNTLSPHVIVISCGVVDPVVYVGKATGTGTGQTAAEAEANALVDLTKQLWLSAYICDECNIPKACARTAVLLGGAPTVFSGPNFQPPPAPPFLATASYVGKYRHGCTSCN